MSVGYNDKRECTDSSVVSLQSDFLFTHSFFRSSTGFGGLPCAPAARFTLVTWGAESRVEKAQEVVGPFLFDNTDVVR